MKKILISLFIISMLAVSMGFVFAAKPTEFDSNGVEVGWEKGFNDCTTIQDGTLEYSDSEEVIPLGYDRWGYNYQAHMFNGGYCDAYRNADWCQEWADVNLMMKWSDEWLSNADCDGDKKLDHLCDPEDAGSSECSEAWLTNHMSREYIIGGGEICKWDRFAKIVVAPADANPVNGFWYTADGTEIGPVIWGAFAKILQISNDPCADEHGVLYHSEAPTGFGFYN